MALAAIFIMASASAQGSCCLKKDAPSCSKATVTSTVGQAGFVDPSLKGTADPAAPKCAAACCVKNCPLEGTPLCPKRTAMTDAEVSHALASMDQSAPVPSVETR